MKNIFITGGSGLVGGYVLDHFLKKKFRVLTTVRSVESKNYLEKKFKKFSQDRVLLILKQDFIKKGFEEKILSFMKKQNFIPNILINNARNIKNLNIDKNSDIHDLYWKNEFYLTVISAYKLTRILMNNYGKNLVRVINISSIYGTVAINRTLQEFSKTPVPMNYSVCKAALIQMTKEFTAKYGSAHLTFNSISYGGISGRESELFRKKYSELSPNRKMLDIDEITSAINFLIDKKSSAINGHNLIVDGGWTIW